MLYEPYDLCSYHSMSMMRLFDAVCVLSSCGNSPKVCEWVEFVCGVWGVGEMSGMGELYCDDGVCVHVGRGGWLGVSGGLPVSKIDLPSFSHTPVSCTMFTCSPIVLRVSTSFLNFLRLLPLAPPGKQAVEAFFFR